MSIIYKAKQFKQINSILFTEINSVRKLKYKCNSRSRSLLKSPTQAILKIVISSSLNCYRVKLITVN